MEEGDTLEKLLASAGNFKWPENALLYHLPPEQELLPDKAQRLCFQSFLLLSKLPFSSKVMPNTKSMSPEGTSSFLCLSFGGRPLILSNFEGLVTFLTNQKLGIGCIVDEAEKVDQEAYLSLLRMRIMPAQHYQIWANRNNLGNSLEVSGCGFTWPLNVVLPHLDHLKYIWHQWDTFRLPPETILRDFEQACATLSQRLGKEEFFFPSKISVLDVMVYANLQAVLTTSLPSKELSRIILLYENMANFCQRFSQLPELTVTVTVTNPKTDDDREE